MKEERGGLLIAKSGRNLQTALIKKINHYLHDLSKEEKITTDILMVASNLLKRSQFDFSLLEQQQYALVMELFENKIVAVEFVRKWDRLIFEIEKEQEKLKIIKAKTKFHYSGNKLSLNFQDIPVRDVLQVFADFTEFNIVVSDAVAGNISLHLNDVPWDQALDIILKSKGLGFKKEGNVVWIATVKEINLMNYEEELRLQVAHLE